MHGEKESLELRARLIIIALIVAAILGPVISEGNSQRHTSKNGRSLEPMTGPASDIRPDTARVLLERVEALETEMKAIQMRNKRVEADKAWEISHTRHILVALITYVLASVVLWLIAVEKPYLGALIPTLGYILSTLTLEFGKRYWIAHFFER